MGSGYTSSRRFNQTTSSMKCNLTPFSLRGSLQMALEVLGVADQPSVDKDLRHRLRSGDRADDLGADRVVERDLGVCDSGFGQQSLRLGAERAAFTRQNSHLIGLFGLRVQVSEHCIGIRHD